MLPSSGQYDIIKSMDKKEEKELEYLFAHMNRLWAGLMVLGGGLTGIVFSSNFHFHFTLASTLKFSLFIFGMLLLALMIIGLTNIKSEIDKKIKGGLK